MRVHYGQQLEELNKDLIEMGAYCEDCISEVAIALNGKQRAENQKSGEQEEMNLLNKVYVTDASIDQMERDIESLCLKLLLQQQPVAGDLRLISAALKMISDMERIGDQCADIADIVRVLDSKNALDLESHIHIQDMASATKKMVTAAVDSYVARNLAAARIVIQSDDEVDDLFDKVKKEIIDLVAKYPEKGEALLDLLMIAKYFERIGDHATNVAEWVEFSITGEHQAKTKYQDLNSIK
ncbi:phosphate signaling complex protein PhoU [Brotaphodocola sp.]|uniref:phosphate signaling complex protein PhoU n=1 Tax=Brotaphodocola sp. TaxID=3073577 RepID=UPI003D7EEA6C